MSAFDLSARLFLQLAVIAAAGRLAAWAGRRLLQPPVVCEMIAGVLLGPSLFGWLAPGLSAAVFPRDSMPILFAVSQLGLALYMFAMGLEFRYDLLAKGWRGSAVVSLAGIAAPLVLGAWLGLRLHASGGFFAAATSPGEAMLFVGAAVSITAFPMLARIIVERGLAGTRIGALAMGAGAFDDVAAWCLLAVLLASFDSNPSVAALAIGGGAALVALLFFVVRPAAAALVSRDQPAALGGAGLSSALIALMLASWLSDSIRLYAVFGAFMLGLVLPRGPFAARLRERVEPVTTAILVPVFFAYSGLNTRFDLLNSWPLWLAAGLILLVSTAAKGVACGLAARVVGYSWPDSIAVGTLMNSRGLMELILLNIGLQRGVITPTLFTILVLMAAVTTVAASPLFELVRPRLSAGRPGSASVPSSVS
jgi:Kef-type K+ transport system membrane component KefB